MKLYYFKFKVKNLVIFAVCRTAYVIYRPAFRNPKFAQIESIELQLLQFNRFSLRKLICHNVKAAS